jgi:mannose-6-phosphate isomerase-like protein (cupin superfamily)
MHFTNESQHEYRYGDKGPKYLARGPRSDFGIVTLQPGQDFQCHKHERIEEAWYTVEGEIHLYVDGECHHLKQGDYLRCDPGEAHYFVNKGNVPWKAVFVKAPYDPDDGVTVENPV